MIEEPKISAAPVDTQPAAQPRPNYMPGPEKWQNGVFDCFEGPDNLCLKATFCPCFVYGKTQARYRDPNLAGYSSFNEDCLAFAGLNACCGLGWVLHLIRRREVGTQYRLEGEPITDCLLSSFCNCCSLIQVDKEIIAQHAKTGLAGTGGYVKPEGMVAGPPPV